MKRPALKLFSFILLASTTTVTHPSFAQDLVAHRGASFDAPENTLAAFKLAWEQGADAIEGDFYLSADGHIVCHHDATTKKTASRELVIAESTLEELRTLEYGSWMDEQFAGEPIPTLEEVLATVPHQKRILIEIKCGPEIAAPLSEILADCDLSDEQLTIIAFDHNVIAECKRRMPNIRAYWLTSFKPSDDGSRWEPELSSVLATLRQCNADGLDCKAVLEVLTPRFVAAIREADLELHCWTVNDVATASRLRELGVDSITTDRPAWLRGELDN